MIASTNTNQSFHEKLRSATAYHDIKRTQQEMNREITVNLENYCSIVFNSLVRSSHIQQPVNTASPSPKDPTRNLLKELLYMQLLSFSGNEFVMTPSLELFCFKTLLEPSKSFTKDKRIKVLCLLLIQNQRFAKLPSIIGEFFSKSDVADMLSNDPEMNPVVFRLLNMFADSATITRHLQNSIIQPYILQTTFTNDQQQQQFKDTQLYTITCSIPFVMNVLQTQSDIAIEFSSSPSLLQLEKVFKSWLLKAGTFSEKKKAVFRGGTTFVTELDGSTCTGIFTALNHSSSYSRRQILQISLFSTLHSWIRTLYSDQMSISNIMTVPPTVAHSKTTSHKKNSKFDESRPMSFGEINLSPILESTVNRAHSYEPPQQTHKQHAPMDNEFLDSTVQYCLRIIQQAEFKYNNNKESAKMLFSSSYIESVLVETIRQMDEICTLYPIMVAKVFPSLKKLFHVLSAFRSAQQQALHSFQQQQQLQKDQQTVLSTFRRKYTSLKPPRIIKQIPSTLAALQQYSATRSNFGSLLLSLVGFFIHHIHTLVYDPQPLFQTFFTEQFALCYRETSFPIETMILYLENHKLIHHETRLFDDYYPQLFKLLACSPYQIVQEFLVILPSLISKTNYLDIFHRIVDLPLLAFILDSDSKRQSPNSEFTNQLFEAIVSDSINSEHEYWQNNVIGAEDWTQMLAVATVPEISLQVAQCVPGLLEVYFETLISEENESYLRDILPTVLRRVITLFPFSDHRILKDIKHILLKNFSTILKRWPLFVVELKTLFLQTLQDSKEDVFVNVCYSIGECIANCSDERLTTQITVQYFEVFELVTFELIAKARVEHKLRSKGIENELVQYSPVDYSQSLNILISSMCKASGRCPDLVSRVIVCLANLIKHAECLHPSVVQRANEASRLLRFPSIVTSLLVADSNEEADGTPKPTHILVSAKGSHRIGFL